MKKLMTLVLALSIVGVLAVDSFARGGRGGGRGGAGRGSRAAAGAALRRARAKRDGKAEQERTRSEDRNLLRRLAEKYRRTD